MDFVADKYGKNTGFIYKSADRKTKTEITYRKFREDLDAIGAYLISKGLKGKRIVVIGPNSYQWLAAYYAVVINVGVVVPLDKELPDGDLKGLATAAEVACVFTTKKHQAMFEEMLKNHEGSMEYVVGMYTKPEEAGDVLSLEALIEEAMQASSSMWMERIFRASAPGMMAAPGQMSRHWPQSTHFSSGML